MTAPDISNRSEEMLGLWLEDRLVQDVNTVEEKLMLEDLLTVYDYIPLILGVSRADLVHRMLFSDDTQLQVIMRLLRYKDSNDKRFRLIFDHVMGKQSQTSKHPSQVTYLS